MFFGASTHTRSIISKNLRTPPLALCPAYPGGADVYRAEPIDDQTRDGDGKKKGTEPTQIRPADVDPHHDCKDHYIA